MSIYNGVRVSDMEVEKPLIHTDQVCWTPGVEAILVTGECAVDHFSRCITLHLSGDWGWMCAEDKATNDVALKQGLRIMSAWPINPEKPCRGWGDNTFWVITEADRTVTTIILPSEY